MTDTVVSGVQDEYARNAFRSIEARLDALETGGAAGLSTPDSDTSSGGNIVIRSGNGLTGGGDVAIVAGDETGPTPGTGGGSVTAQAGHGLTPGDIDFAAGNVEGAGSEDAWGGGAIIRGGAGGSNSFGGPIRLIPGQGGTDGGDIFLQPADAGSGRQGLVRIGGAGLPSANPLVEGALWKDGAALKVSAG